MISKEEFKTYVDSLMPEALKQEIKKDKTASTVVGAIIVCMGAIGAIWAFVSLLIIPKGVMATSFNIALKLVCALFGVFFIIVGFIIINRKSSAIIKFEKENKIKILSKLLEGQKFSYNQGSYIDKDALKASCFVQSPIDIYTGEDLFTIKIDDKTSLTISDVCAKEEDTYTDSNGNTQTRTYTLYSGVFGYVVFPENFSCNMFINCRPSYKYNAQKVNLEDIEYNKQLRTSATDQLEARLILSPDVMQKLKDLKHKLKNLKISLIGSIMFFGSPYRNLFRIEGGTRHFSSDNLMQIYDDIKLILDVIEEIKNNDKIFKKEGK